MDGGYLGDMERLQAYKFELRPDGAQRRLMRRFAGSRRHVYNRALALQKVRYERGEKRLGYAGLCQELTAWRKDEVWLRNSHSQVLQQALKDLDRAYRNFFEKRAAFPRFKKKGRRDSFRSQVCYATVTLNGGRWFVSIQTRREVDVPVHRSASAVGIDLGVLRFATLSDGKVFEPLNSFKAHRRRLAHHQRRMARCFTFGKNWHKARRKVQRIHARIRHCRLDYLHKVSNAISKNHAMVCVEDLQVRNMSQSAAGTVEHPSRNVRAKAALNRSILDQGWAEFRRQLEYKLGWKGGMLIAVPPHHSSQRCPVCGYTAARNRLTQAQFRCRQCGYCGNADRVAAINILARGHRVTACGDTSSAQGTPAQEPSEANLHEMIHAAL
jgi:putative transposase